MVINLNAHEVSVSELSFGTFDGNIVLSDTDESGTSEVRNIVVLSQASYNALGSKNSDTLYFIT